MIKNRPFGIEYNFERIGAGSQRRKSTWFIIENCHKTLKMNEKHQN
ncbi:MAG: hypothetical protein RLZZ628_266 [Bacteroidota bacterium]